MVKSIQVQDLPRVNQIAAVLAKNGFGHLLHLIGLSAAKPQTVAGQDTKPWARRIRQVLVELGPAYVKLGQVLSVRPDILPKDVLVEFQTLQDNVPPMSFSDVRDVVEAELNRPLEDAFTTFDEVPLGSASIAQVHRATLLDGREVAVKLQRKGIGRIIHSDLNILYSLSQILEANINLPGLYTPTAIVREFDAAIQQELDFCFEMRNCERMARDCRNQVDIKIPATYPALSTRRMLVLELIDGAPLKTVIADLAERGDTEEASRIAHLVMESVFQQVFTHGFFHGDPHPGNLFVTRSGKLALLDFGITGTLTGAMQDTIVGAFTSMVFRDAEALAMTVYRAGATRDGTRVELRAFIDECERMMIKYYGASLDDIANPNTFVEVVQLCARFQISLPAEFAVLSRAIALIEGEVRAMLPGVDIVEEVRPYATRLAVQRFSPERMAHDMGRFLVLAQGQLNAFPTQMNQVLMDLEGGNITVITRDPDAPLMREEIRAAVLRLSLAFMASTISLGSLIFLSLAVFSPSVYLSPIFALTAILLLAGGGSLYGALGIHVFFARFLDASVWRRRLLSVLRFFSWRRS